MPGKNIGPTIGLGGEAEFRKQIKNINAEISVLGAELEKAAVSFEGNEQSQEALSEKTRILTETNEKLGAAIELTKKQHDEVAEKYGETSVAALKLEKDVYKLEKQFIKNEKTIESNKEALEKLDEGLEENDRALEDNVESLNNNSEALKENGERLEENSNKVSFWSQEVQNEFEAASGMVDGCIGFITNALKSMSDFVTDSASIGAEITASAEQAGLGVQRFQELGYATQQLHIDMGALTGSMKDLGEKAFDAMIEPTSEAAELFKSIGVNVTYVSGELKDSQTLWQDTMIALGNIGNETERNAVATKLFGGASEQLVALMSAEGVSTLNMYAAEAKNVGAVLDNGTLRALDQLNKTQIESQATIDGVKNRLAADLAPSLATASEAVANLTLAFEPLIRDALSWALNHIPEITTATTMFVGALIALKIVSTLTPLINLMNSSLATTNATLVTTNAALYTNPIVMVATAVVGAVTGLIAGLALFNEKSEEIGDGMTDMAYKMENMGESAAELEKVMNETAKRIDWNSINLSFEQRFSLLGTNSAEAFRKSLMNGLNGFDSEMSGALSNMKLNVSSGVSGSNVPALRDYGSVQQTLDISLYLDKYKVAEILYDPLTGVARQKGK